MSRSELVAFWSLAAASTTKSIPASLADQGRLLPNRVSVSDLRKKKQDNFRVSVGVVIRSIHKKKRKLEEETQPEP